MIQKAYDTLVTTMPSVCGGCWEMVGSAAPCMAVPLCRCCRFSEDDVLSVQLTPRTQLSSVRKGSATRGLIRAPRPIKKCKAYGERRTQSWKPTIHQRGYVFLNYVLFNTLRTMDQFSCFLSGYIFFLSVVNLYDGRINLGFHECKISIHHISGI